MKFRSPPFLFESRFAVCEPSIGIIIGKKGDGDEDAQSSARSSLLATVAFARGERERRRERERERGKKSKVKEKRRRKGRRRRETEITGLISRSGCLAMDVDTRYLLERAATAGYQSPGWRDRDLPSGASFLKKVVRDGTGQKTSNTAYKLNASLL